MRVKALIKYDGTDECLKTIERSLSGSHHYFSVRKINETDCGLFKHGDYDDMLMQSRPVGVIGAGLGEWFIVFRADYTDADRLPANSEVLSENLACCVLRDNLTIDRYLQDCPEIVYLADHRVFTHSTYTGNRYLRYEFRQSYYPLGYE